MSGRPTRELDEIDPDLREVFVLMSELEEMSAARVRRARIAFEAARNRHRAKQPRTPA